MALAMSAQLFQHGASIGYSFSILDIGGGYPGEKGTNGIFLKVSDAINKALDVHFSSKIYPDLVVIAEPGERCCHTYLSNY